MNNLPLLNDLRVFMLVARRAGFAAVAEELGVSPAFVSKRIALLEQTLNVVLLHRTPAVSPLPKKESGFMNGRSGFCRMSVK